MIKFLKTLYRIVKSYDTDMEALAAILENHTKELSVIQLRHRDLIKELSRVEAITKKELGRLDKEQTANLHMRDAQARYLNKRCNDILRGTATIEKEL